MLLELGAAVAAIGALLAPAQPAPEPEPAPAAPAPAPAPEQRGEPYVASEGGIEIYAPDPQSPSDASSTVIGHTEAGRVYHVIDGMTGPSYDLPLCGETRESLGYWKIAWHDGSVAAVPQPCLARQQ